MPTENQNVKTSPEMRHRDNVTSKNKGHTNPTPQPVGPAKSVSLTVFLFLTETWRDHSEETLEVDGGTKMILSGGGPHQGVGIVVSNRCWGSMQDVVFHVYSPRVCSLTFQLANKNFVASACYMPTLWDTDEAVMEVYELLDLILFSRDCVNRLLLLGGDHPDETKRL